MGEVKGHRGRRGRNENKKGGREFLHKKSKTDEVEEVLPGRTKTKQCVSKRDIGKTAPRNGIALAVRTGHHRKSDDREGVGG